MLPPPLVVRIPNELYSALNNATIVYNTKSNVTLKNQFSKIISTVLNPKQLHVQTRHHPHNLQQLLSIKRQPLHTNTRANHCHPERRFKEEGYQADFH